MLHFEDSCPGNGMFKVIIVEWIYRLCDVYVRIGNLLLPIISSLNLMREMCNFIAVHYYDNVM